MSLFLPQSRAIRLFWLSLLFSASTPALANIACPDAPPLPKPDGTVIDVSSETQLQNALGSLQSDTTLMLAPGKYYLSSTMFIRKSNVTLRGDSNTCDEVEIIGPGMENSNAGVTHGIWSDASNLKVQNLSISEVYLHAINLNPGAESPHLYNVRLTNSGQQFVKANPVSFGNGADNGVVEYSVFEYTDGPPTTDHGGGTGYTNGVDVHAGSGWIIRNNVFSNFHTDDSADHLWNAAILMWNGASDTLVENNRFIDVDRAVAMGLANRTNDHFGGIVRNNMVTYSSGLYSAYRRNESDAAIIVWSSPQTKVYHNTILTRGNLNKAIEFRFNTDGAQAKNNLVDAPLGTRDGGNHVASNNSFDAVASLFRSPATGDLHLLADSTGVMDSVPALTDAAMDFDGQLRSETGPVDLGADEYQGASPPNPPSNVKVVN